MGKIDELKKKYNKNNSKEFYELHREIVYTEQTLCDAIDEAVAITKSEALEQGELVELDEENVLLCIESNIGTLDTEPILVTSQERRRIAKAICAKFGGTRKPIKCEIDVEKTRLIIYNWLCKHGIVNNVEPNDRLNLAESIANGNVIKENV